MPTLLSDPPATVYVLLTLAALVGAGVFLARRDRAGLAALAAGVLLLGLVFLLDTLFRSGREHAVAHVQTAAAATRSKNYPRIISLLSEQFRFKGATKKTLADRFKAIDQQYGWTGAEVWDFDRADAVYTGDDAVRVGFMTKAKDYQVMFYVRASFRREADGEWRLTGLEFFDPVRRDAGGPVAVPGLG